jgi:hypothetical protein
MSKERFECPYCRITAVANWNTNADLNDPDEMRTWLQSHQCPGCDKYTVRVLDLRMNPATGKWIINAVRLVKPKASTRMIPPEVPERFAKVYTEAAAVLADSPMASAAMSRRCLQDLLREKGGFNAPSKKLFDEIELALKSHLPTGVADMLHYVREVGNLAAHPLKDENTGTIVDVEPGEADANLDALDLLFDHYFVAPVKAKAKKDALAAKIAAAKGSSAPKAAAASKASGKP